MESCLFCNHVIDQSNNYLLFILIRGMNMDRIRRYKVLLSMEKIYQSLLKQKNWGNNLYMNTPRVSTRHEKKNSLISSYIYCKWWPLLYNNIIILRHDMYRPIILSYYSQTRSSVPPKNPLMNLLFEGAICC